MTAYGSACVCGWSVGPVGNARRKDGIADRLAEWWVNLRHRLHKLRCPL